MQQELVGALSVNESLICGRRASLRDLLGAQNQEQQDELCVSDAWVQQLGCHAESGAEGRVAGAQDKWQHREGVDDLVRWRERQRAAPLDRCLAVTEGRPCQVRAVC